MTEFVKQPKIARLNRAVIVTEKIDGTNAAVLIHDDGTIQACSKNHVLTDDLPDNHGFRAWVMAHKDELLAMGPGLHRGEFWGAGIGKRYPGRDKRLSLFNVKRWTETPPPPCCDVVPVLAELDRPCMVHIDRIVDELRENGSVAASGCKAEGVVVYLTSSGTPYKVTCEKDEEWKGKSNTQEPTHAD